MARPAKAFAGVRRCKRSTGPFPPRLRRGPRLTPPAQSRSALPRRGAWMVGQGRGLRPQRASPRGSSGCPVTKAGAGAARFPSGRKASLFSPSPAHPYGSANPRHRSALVCLASSLRLTRIGGTRVLWRVEKGGDWQVFMLNKAFMPRALRTPRCDHGFGTAVAQVWHGFGTPHSPRLPATGQPARNVQTLLP